MSSAGGAGAARKVLKGKPKPLYFWTSADVNKWWRKHGGLCYQLYGDLLTEHDVGGGYMVVTSDFKYVLRLYNVHILYCIPGSPEMTCHGLRDLKQAINKASN